MIKIKNTVTFKDFQSDYIILSENYNILKKEVDFCTDDQALLYVEIEDN